MFKYILSNILVVLSRVIRPNCSENPSLKLKILVFHCSYFLLTSNFPHTQTTALKFYAHVS